MKRKQWTMNSGPWSVELLPVAVPRATEGFAL
jgi:hypothetical protein